MGYLRRHAEAKSHPRHVLEGVRSILVVAMIYGRPDQAPLGPTQGKVARYARGDDYHEVLWRKLEALLGWIKEQCPGVVGRATCDTAPILERDFARLAGLGWIGKNTCLIDRKAGSFTVLGSLLLDIELAYDLAERIQPLRDLYPLPRRLPHRRIRRPLPARCSPMHQLLDDRAQGADSRPGGQSSRGLGLRLRHLPGRLSVEPQGSARSRAGTGGAAGPDPSRPDRVARRGPGELHEVIERVGPEPVEAVGLAPQRGLDPGLAEEPRSRPGPGGSSERPRPRGPRGLGLGPGPDRLSGGLACPSASGRGDRSGGPAGDP